MTALLRLSNRIYAATLPLYPADLLRDFGPEMAEAFAEEMRDALQNGGLEVVLVWWRSLWEILRIALPRRAENPAVAVPLIAFALSESLMSGELMAAMSHKSPLTIPLEAIPVVALMPSLAAALTAWAVVSAGNSGLPAQLKLGPK